MDKHGAEVAADLRRFYGFDLLDWVRGHTSPRYVLGLIGSLPDDAASVAAMLGGRAHRGWDVQAYLTADLIDAVQGLVYVQSAQASKNPKAVKQPKPYPRPGAKARKREQGGNHFMAALAGKSAPSPTGENTFKLPAAVLARAGRLS